MRQDIVFVGNVGEAGPGDLRGVRYLMTKGKHKDRVKTFLSMDGTNPARVVIGGVGSKRYRITYKGPGGHSFGAFGLVNPIVAMSQTVVDFYRIPVPATPKTTYSASVTGGGTSINSIPNEAFMEFDMRSESPKELAKLEQAFLAIVKKSVEGENAARSTKEGPVTADIKLIGKRAAQALADRVISYEKEDEGPVMAMGQPTLAAELIGNLLDNAIRYSRPGGMVSVRLTNDVGGPRVEIDDDGPGIPEAEREKVWDRFYRIRGR